MTTAKSREYSLFDDDILDDSQELTFKKDSPVIVVRRSQIGLGVFATEDIAAGEFIAGFYGKVYSAVKASTLPPEAVNHAIQFSPYLWRDSAGAGRYFNHSCEPNCHIKDTFNIVTLRPIHAAEELNWDYSTTENSDWVVPGGRCLCGLPRCRGTIPPYRDLSIDERNAIVDRVSNWLLEPATEHTGRFCTRSQSSIKRVMAEFKKMREFAVSRSTFSSRPRCSSHNSGTSSEKSKSVIPDGRSSSRTATTISCARFVSVTMRRM